MLHQQDDAGSSSNKSFSIRLNPLYSHLNSYRKEQVQPGAFSFEAQEIARLTPAVDCIVDALRLTCNDNTQ